MPELTERELPQYLAGCGLVPLGFAAADASLPGPDRMWKLTASGSQQPTERVPLEGGDLAGRVDAAWLRLARERGVIGADGTFLIAGTGRLPWFSVRLTERTHLADRLTGPSGQGRPGHAEFVTMAADGSAGCGVTTEEYEVWLVAADAARLRSGPQRPEREAAPADLTGLSPLKLNQLFAPDRLTAPLRNGWVLLGFHRNATYLARLHELPEDFDDADAARVTGREAVDRDAAAVPLDDAQAAALAAALGIPVDTTRLTYFLEYQSADRKREQSSARRLS